jgi:tol-pal system protein YbgF
LQRTAVLKSVTDRPLSHGLFRLLMPLGLSLAAGSSGAALFGDDEARRAILELRQRVETLQRQMQSQTQSQFQAQADEITQLRTSLLDLQSQIDALKADLARARGQNEQLARDLSELQKRHKDVQIVIDDRLRRFEPLKVTLDGQEFLVEPGEKRDYDQALEAFRKAEYPLARQSLQSFLARYPTSPYRPLALFWLGNADYVAKDYKEALQRFQQMLDAAPAHPRAPEAMLAISNVQVELKDVRAARRTLEALVAQHPQSEAAQTARERLTRLPAPR